MHIEVAGENSLVCACSYSQHVLINGNYSVPYYSEAYVILLLYIMMIVNIQCLMR